MIIHEFDLDMIPGGSLVSIRVNQYDEDFNLKINLFSRNGNFSVLSGTTALIRGTKPDGNAFSAECSVNGTVVTVTGNQQMTAAAGRAIFELSLRRNGKELNTANFIIDIEQAAMDKDTVASTSVVRELVDIMDNSEEIINAGQQYADSQAAMTELTARSEAAAEAAEAAKEATSEKATQMESRWSEISEQMDRKSAAIASLVTTADEAAKEALEKAGNAENEVAETTNKIDEINQRIDNLILDAQNYVNDGYVEDGEGIFFHDDTELFRMSGIGGGSGGGGGGGSSDQTASTKVSLTNTTGWLSKTIASGASCPVSFVWSSTMDDMPTGDGSVRITANGAVKATMDVSQGAVELDLSSYLATGANVIEVRVTDIEGSYKRISFSVTVIALSISSTFDVATPYTGAISFPYTPVGAVLKTVHFLLDGEEIGTQQTSVSGRQMTYTIPAQAHGGHSIRVYFEAEINGEMVRSNELYFEFISLETLNDSVIITSPYNQGTQPQYTSISIPYTVYDPVSPTAEVKIYADGELLSTQTVDRTEQSYTYRANNAGPLVIQIKSGSTTKTLNITVTESDVKVEAETQNLALYLTSQGRSNNEANPTEWKYEGIEANLTGFNLASDGWQSDEDGITVLRVAGDARITIPYKIFANDFRTTGKTISLEFATRNVMNYDATILSCMNGNRGITLTAQKATLKSEQSEISMQYKEEEHVRIDWVVEKRSEDRLIVMYVNGIASGAVQYPDDDDFSQVAPVNISIGSNDCTIDIYNIRVYDNDLTRFQIADNWIADTQVGTDMLERYTRNNVFDAYGNIVISQLPSNLPYLIINAEELPQYKGDKKTVTGSYVDPLYPSKSFTFTNAEANVQGTSSQYYPRKNYKIKFKGGFLMSNGSLARTYAINPQAIATNTFCFKADVASSEGANNVELARLYNDACPYKTPAQAANAKVRQGIDGFPIVIFWNDGENIVFLGKYNFNNDKGTEEVFGFTDGDESWEIRNNTGNRVLWKSDDYESTVTDENGKVTKAWLNDFEARFPDTDPAYEDSTQLKEFASWAKSTDTTAATGNDLPSAVEYEGVSYTKDTAAYRLAKFKAEAGDYMEMQSALFYYLFTELFLMVDSRAKNAFPSFIGSEVESA